ncbi:MAG: ATP-binding cassette domain-containing protein [Burkholderiales bacterium]
MTTLMRDTDHETEGAIQATPPAGNGFAPPASVPDAPRAAQPIAAEPPGPEAPRPAPIATVLQVALRRLSQDKAPPLPGWAVQPCASDDERFERKLAGWLRRGADLSLGEAGTSLDAALGTSAHMLLVEVDTGRDTGWLLVDCRQGAAALWAGEGDAVAHLSVLDPSSIRRILSLRPSQDLSPRTATSPGSQPRFLPFLREYRGRLLELAAAGVMINGVAILLPLFSMITYDKVVGNHITETLWALAIGLSIAVVLELILKSVRTHTVETVACRMDALTERRLMTRLFEQRGAMPSVGTMLARYRDLAAARDVLSSNWLLAIADTPYVLLFLVIVGVVGGPIVWVPIVSGLLMVLGHALLHAPAQRYGELATQAQTRKVAVLAEALGAGEVVRATYLRHAFSRRFGQLAEEGALAQARGRYWNHLGHHLTGTAVTLCAIGVLVVGVYLIESRELSVGGLIACSMLSARAVSMLAGLTLLASRWSELRRASRKLDELVADTDTAPTTIDAAAAQFSAKGNRLSLRNVSFEHDPARPLIAGLNLDVAPGQLVVLLGKPGAGKSTVLKLLGGLLKPSSGDAMLDGHSISDWPTELRARHIGIKPQDAVLFEGSLAENILAGAEAHVSAERFDEALAVSGLDQWIANGELSLSQKLLPGGANLSGGQRQVIVLARALVSSPPVLLLDEPTVGLDQATEAGIVSRLRLWSMGRTMVVATHSMALVNAADRLIVVEGGKVVADGPRDRVLVQPQRPQPNTGRPVQPANAG